MEHQVAVDGDPLQHPGGPLSQGCRKIAELRKFFLPESLDMFGNKASQADMISGLLIWKLGIDVTVTVQIRAALKSSTCLSAIRTGKDSADGIFGRCQQVPVIDIYKYDISAPALQHLRIILEQLSHRVILRMRALDMDIGRSFPTCITAAEIQGSCRREFSSSQIQPAWWPLVAIALAGKEGEGKDHTTTTFHHLHIWLVHRPDAMVRLNDRERDKVLKELFPAFYDFSCLIVEKYCHDELAKWGKRSLSDMQCGNNQCEQLQLELCWSLKQDMAFE
ncbi:hypothetical protein EK904_008067 [Melospiza melodia maxima]|nr:hypothetical protein EK904_008067 [Melospiza melodia maxima]